MSHSLPMDSISHRVVGQDCETVACGEWGMHKDDGGA